jgi:uncharacterized phage protein (TIGR01671 family)
MRELKFRAWDPEEKKMYDIQSIDFARQQFWVQHDLCSYSFGVVPILEYIGRQDRKGKDIYEGDIVRINHPDDRTGNFTNAIGEVFWWDEEAAWHHTNNHGRPPKRMWDYVEVLGNRYQNPELLPQLEEAQ